MKVVITGGAGFIGCNLAVFLRGRGYEVVCLDNFSRASENAVGTLEKLGVNLVKGDVRDYKVTSEVARGCDVVVHAAALIDAEESVKKPLLYLENNALGTAVVAKVCVDLAIPRLVYLSSAAVYGEPARLPVSESHPLNPVSPYGLSKLMGERVIKHFSSLYGLRYVILRLFNVYGFRQHGGSYSGVIARFVERVRRGKPPIIYGDGRQTRDFIHVRDVCRVVEKVLKTEYVNEVFNVGFGKPVKIEDLARLILRLSGLNLEPVHVPPRPGDVRHSYADITKARQLLGFKPKIDLEEGVKELLSGVPRLTPAF